MPDKAAAEACAKGKLTPEQLQDSDIVFTTVLGCLGQVPMGQALSTSRLRWRSLSWSRLRSM